MLLLKADMSNFEQDFYAQMQNKDTKGGVPNPVMNAPVQRNPLDKRWFIIGGLAVLLGAALVILNIIFPKKPIIDNSTIFGSYSCNSVWENDPEITDMDETAPISSPQSDTAEIDTVEFRNDYTYTWIYQTGGTERGAFVHNESKLALSKLTFEWDGKTTDFTGDYFYNVTRTGNELTLSFLDSQNIAYICERKEDV